MAIFRSLLFALTFYPATALWVLASILVSPFGAGPLTAVVKSWVRMHYTLTTNLLGIQTRLDGILPQEPHLIAVKHESMYETIEMVRLSGIPIVVLKRELYDIPLFGFVTKCYGVIPVDRSAGAKALRDMLAQAKDARTAGRSVLIFPEGTRVRPGETPPLGAGFAGLYRALGLPVVPVAVDSGRLWGRGLIKGSGVVTFKVGETISPGIAREEIEARVHAAINALN